MQNIRNTSEYKQWVKQVKRRDREACRRCGFDKDLEVHHIMPLQIYCEPEYACWVANGLTLCSNCHRELKNKELTTNLIKFIERCPHFHNGHSLNSLKVKMIEQLFPVLYESTGGLDVMGPFGDEMVSKAKRHTREAAAVEKQRAARDYLWKIQIKDVGAILDNQFLEEYREEIFPRQVNSVLGVSTTRLRCFFTNLEKEVAEKDCLLRGYNRVIEYCTEALELVPEYAESYKTRGAAYYGIGDYDRAILDYNRAIRLISDWAMVYANRGEVYLLKGDYDRAIADYYQILRIQLKHFPI